MNEILVMEPPNALQELPKNDAFHRSEGLGKNGDHEDCNIADLKAMTSFLVRPGEKSSCGW